LTRKKSNAELFFTIFHQNRVNTIAFCANGNFLAIGSENGTVALLDRWLLNDRARCIRLLGRQKMARFLATKMSTGADMHLHAKRLKEIIDKVDAKNEALHLSLMINPEAQGNTKHNKKKRKIGS